MADAKGEGQSLIGTFFSLLGAELSDRKRCCMAVLGEFLGLAHDLARIITEQVVAFWPRQGLIDELSLLLTGLRTTRIRTPATASKFRGAQGFCDLGIFGKVSMAALAPFRQRQYLDAPPWSTSHTMCRSVE